MPALDLVNQGLVAEAPPHRTVRYENTDETIRRMYEVIRGLRGEKSLKLRLTVEDIIRGIQPRDRLSQLFAIYTWFDRHYHFVNDPLEVELVKDPVRLLEEIQVFGIATGDCDDASIFLGTAPRTIGMQTRLVRTGFRRSQRGLEGPWTHVLVVTRDQYRRPIVLDPVAGPKSKEMLGRVKQVKYA